MAMKKAVSSRRETDKSMETSTKRDRKEWIGQQLRRVYREALAEPLPEDLLALLRQVGEKQGK